MFVKLMGWWDVEQVPGDRGSFSCLCYQLKIVTRQHWALLCLGDFPFGPFPSFFHVLSDQATLSKDEIWNGSLARHSHFSSSGSMTSASGICEPFFLQGFVTAEPTAVFFRMFFFFRTKHSLFQSYTHAEKRAKNKITFSRYFLPPSKIIFAKALIHSSQLNTVPSVYTLLSLSETLTHLLVTTSFIFIPIKTCHHQGFIISSKFRSTKTD